MAYIAQFIATIICTLTPFAEKGILASPKQPCRLPYCLSYDNNKYLNSQASKTTNKICQAQEHAQLRNMPMWVDRQASLALNISAQYYIQKSGLVALC